MTYITRKTINESNGYVLAEYPTNGAITFVADIPYNSIVIDIKADDCYLRETGRDNIKFPRNDYDGNTKIVAQLENMYNTELYKKVEAGEVKSFIVEYIDYAVVEEF